MRPRKKISQSDIAEALGISNVSVSNALAGRKGVGRELSEKVRRKAIELGYDTEENANAVSGMILLVVSDNWPREKRGVIEKIAVDRGFHVELCTLKEILSGACVDRWKNPDCCGVLLPEQLPTGVLRILLKTIGRPMVGAGFFDANIPIDYVIDDGFHGVQTAMRYLYDRGYETILYVMPEEKHSLSESEARMGDDQLMGFRCGRYLRMIEQSAVLEKVPAFDLEETRDILEWNAVEEFLDERKQPVVERSDGKRDKTRSKTGKFQRTAFLCGDMASTAALIQMLDKRGIRVPEDVAVLGFSDEEDSKDDLGARTTRRRITAYQSCRRDILIQCCELLRRRRTESEEKAGNVHMTTGEIVEGDTVSWQSR